MVALGSNYNRPERSMSGRVDWMFGDKRRS
jgi:hypothetical protein